jgi:hypothetical protein
LSSQKTKKGGFLPPFALFGFFMHSVLFAPFAMLFELQPRLDGLLVLFGEVIDVFADSALHFD